jgi:methylated-DNA-[protein]-cysteine S-methyltransferase
MKTETASCTIYFRSPIGPMKIVGTGYNLTALDFVEEMGTDDTPNPPAVLKDTYTQLDEYFRGRRQGFTLPLAPGGTEFQQSVWHELEKIPFGHTVAYGDIARAMGRPKACRAVGGANNKNPISIIIPCHRIVGADRRLTGYGGGLWRKAWLLKHEKIRIVKNRIIS